MEWRKEDSRQLTRSREKRWMQLREFPKAERYPQMQNRQRERRLLRKPPFQLVPMNELANYSSLKKRMTDEEFALAYQAALNLVTPYIGLPLEEQIYGITVPSARCLTAE